MAYNITLTNGTNLVTVADGTTDTSYTSLTLIGKNFAGYGSFLNENFVKVLENFANSSEPPNSLEGQIWWDTSSKVLKVRNGSVWKSVSSSTSSSSQPVNPTTGDLWWDTANGQLKVWGGSVWVVVGPAYTATQGQTGIVADVVSETGGAQSHIVVKFFVNNSLVAILSKDSSFAVSSLAGFSTINPGFNLSTVGNLGYFGLTDNASHLGGVAAASFLRNDQAGTTSGSLGILSNTGLTVGATNDASINVSGTSINFQSTVTSKDLNLYVNRGGSAIKALSISGAVGGDVLLVSDPTSAMGAATKQYVDNSLSGPSSAALKRDGSNTITGNIAPINPTLSFGSASAPFSTIYSTLFAGNASNALMLGGASAGSYVRTDASSVMTVPLTVQHNGGITLGTGADFTIDAATAGLVSLRSNVASKGMNLIIRGSDNALKNAIAIDGATGLATVLAAPTAALGIATRQYVLDQVAGGGGGSGNLGAVASDIIPATNNLYNLGTDPGSGGKKWAHVWATTFHGNATTANYADLAERFEADQPYAPGTVVELGGVKEITAAATDLSENVFGVISTQAAYLMNAGAGTDSTHPPIAMQGRVPVNVTGVVRKGDRLVSAGNGLARAALRSEITPYNVIGRALTNKNTTGEGTVEAIVKLNS